MSTIRSMTGYSRGSGEEGGFAVSVVAKATNHRFLDLQIRLAGGLEALESHLRRWVKEHVARGHLDLFVTLERVGSSGLELNRKMLAAYAVACQQLRSDFGFDAQPDPVALLRIPGLVESGNGSLTESELERVRQLLERVTVETLNSLNQMRAREGEALERDVRGRLERLGEVSRQVEGLARKAPEFYRARLEGRVRELLGSIELDAGRLAQEVAYLASRSDIAEELARFRSHLDQTHHLLDPAASREIGKKFDFLLQEMNREANTMLAKTTDVPEVGLEITRRAIEMKTEIEKLREQAQNIE